MDYKKATQHNYSYDYGVRPQCCCGLHVRTGALIIGIIGVIACIVAIVCSSIYGMYLQLGIAIGTLLLYGLLIIACEFKQPMLMVPFLVMNFIGIMFYGFVYIVSLFYLFIDLVASISVDYTNRNAMHDRMLRWLTFFKMVAVLVSLVIGMWFETIVYRAYRCMKDELIDMPSTAASNHFLKPATFKKSPPGQIV